MVCFDEDKWGLGHGDYIFAMGGTRNVNASLVAQAMKRVAVMLGLDVKKVSAHSLRYGGATMLASHGLPQYVTAYYGGWTADSGTLRLYARLSESTAALVSRCFALTQPSAQQQSMIEDALNG